MNSQHTNWPVRHTSRMRRQLRRGSVLVELVVMTVVISVVASVLVPMVSAVGRARAATRYQQLALMEINNVRAQALRYDAETDGDFDVFVEKLPIGAWFQSRYPNARLNVAVDPSASVPDDTNLTPVRMTLSSGNNGPYSERPPISIVTWLPAAPSEVTE